MNKFLGDKAIEILNTNFYYGKLEKGWDRCQYDAFYESAKNILNSNEGLENDSDKILSALCYVYKNRLSDTLDSDKCNFLYFWLGDILLKKLKKNIFFQDIISKLFKTLTNDDNHQICELPHFFMLEEYFKDIKTIFDCSEDYKSYKEQHIYPIKSCNQNYKTNLDTDINIYNKFYNKCKVEKKGYLYCEAFSKYFPQNNPNLFSEFNCSLELNEPKSEKFGEGHESEFVQLQDEEINRESPQEEKLTVADRNRGEYLAVSPGLSVIESETGGLQNFGSSDYADSNLINKLLGRTTRMNHNPLMEEQLINNFYQPEQFNSERSGYNISYRPV
ncbi:hypothetical protein PVIIG_06151 [Plasmodium vivax India VII]|uniref:VIR protein n=1 Tax=Plasmodium vivax India VII TaxID=1077284 RepID=A0A0J9V8S1_PLAVI|nr:hypothetical protein PVIIG_06151 [Plasmodium vivax India VII]